MSQDFMVDPKRAGLFVRTFGGKNENFHEIAPINIGERVTTCRLRGGSTDGHKNHIGLLTISNDHPACDALVGFSGWTMLTPEAMKEWAYTVEQYMENIRKQEEN